jgi:F0F1-type ATP synthase epsilon subunit
METLTLMKNQCSATSKQSGERCRRPPITGGSVCRMHGGAAPQVLAKAAERMREARDMALERLIEDLNPGIGNEMDPKVRLEIVDKLSRQIELLEGRVTDRREVSQAEARQTVNQLKVQLAQIREASHAKAERFAVLKGGVEPEAEEASA